MRFHLTHRSDNRKTGDMPVASASPDTCWSGCPMRAVCYGSAWPLCLHWAKNCKLTWQQFLREIADLPPNVVWRYGDVGDLPGRSARIDEGRCTALVAIGCANGRRPYCYSHKPVVGHPANARIIAAMNRGGFTVNLSAEGLHRADELAALQVAPVVAVLPRSLGDWRVLHTPAGRRVLRCPHEWQKRPSGAAVQCANGCGGTRGPICSWPDRNFIIGLTAHGRVRKVEAIIAATEARYEARDVTGPATRAS